MDFDEYVERMVLLTRVNHGEYMRIVSNRKLAISIFPDLFDNNFHLRQDASLDKLNQLYDKFKAGQLQNVISYWQLQEIQGAYNYVKDLIENRYKPDERKISYSIYEQYYLLINEIAKYHFVYQNKEKKTGGYYQNLNNKAILFELSLLEPCLNDMLKHLDSVYERSSTEEEKNAIVYKCINLGALLNMSYSSLAECKSDYQIENQKERINFSDLGMAKWHWRKFKNISCQDIIRFYECFDKDFGIPYPSKGFYNKYTIELKKSPNYYCFLTNDEIKEQSKKNKDIKSKKRELSKRMSKKNQVH